MKRIIKLFVNIALVLGSSAGAYAQLSEYRYASVKMVTSVTTLQAKTTNICTADFLASADKLKHTQPITAKTKEGIAAQNIETEHIPIAHFNIVGQPYMMFAITLPSACSIVTGNNGITGRIFVNSLSSVGILGPDGSQVFGIGASMGLAKAPVDKYFEPARIPVTVHYY